MSHYHSVFPLLLKNAFCTTLRLNEMLCTTLIKEKAFRQDRCLESFVPPTIPGTPAPPRAWPSLPAHKAPTPLRSSPSGPHRSYGPAHTTLSLHPQVLSLSLALRPAHSTRSASPPLDPARPGPARTLSLSRLSGPYAHGTYLPAPVLHPCR